MPPPKLSWQDTVCQVASLTLANALIFQEELAAHNHKVKTLGKSLKAPSLVVALTEHWTFISKEINYVPIFKIARDILQALPATAEPALRKLADSAQQIVSMRAALRHDLMGRIYHRLLLEAKYLGTYYTSISSATLLLKLTLTPKRCAIDWSDIEEIKQLRIADLASGTGTLLMASVQAVTDNYVRACAAKDKPPELARLHGALMETVLHGYDVVPSALHLTASTLALLAPQIQFGNMNLWSVPMGGPNRRLGSIDFIETGSISVQQDMFGSGVSQARVSGKGTHEAAAAVPMLDLAVMNPPFTRSVGNNLLFGSMPEGDRRGLQDRLKEMLAKPGVLAKSTAGLGSVFIAVADRYVKPGGGQSLVIPRTILSGVSWKETRELLNRNYEIEYVIVSHDPRKWSFSENTALGEVLIVARRLKNREQPADTRFINLWENPGSSIPALAIAAQVLASDPVALDGDGLTRVMLGDREVGEAFTAPLRPLGNEVWWYGAYGQTELLRVAGGLLKGYLVVPGKKKKHMMPMVQLRELGALGPDRRDIGDAFNIAKAATAYPAFWGHDSDTVIRMAEVPNGYLAPLSKAKKGRPFRDPKLMWSRSGRILLAERLRLNTQRLIALGFKEPVLSNVWWPLALDEAGLKAGGIRVGDAAKILTLWLNSTMGLVVAWSQREDTEGAWVGLKKPTWADMPVLDPRALSKEQREGLCAAFDNLRSKEWMAWPDLEKDETRSEADAAVAEALKLPNLAWLRSVLAREPVLSDRPLT